MDGNLAEIRLFSGTFVPRNWASCSGQLLPIAQNTALFSLLGTNFGGDGRTSFGIPDLRGRIPVGTGIGPGLTPRHLGNLIGDERNVLGVANLPAHSHTAAFTQTSGTGTGTASGSATVTVTPVALNDAGDQTSPLNNVPAKFTPQNDDAFGEFDAGSPGDYVNMHPLTGTASVIIPAASTSITVTGAVTLGNTGSSSPIYIVQPGLSLQYIICISGIFPSRN